MHALELTLHKNQWTPFCCLDTKFWNIIQLRFTHCLNVFKHYCGHLCMLWAGRALWSPRSAPGDGGLLSASQHNQWAVFMEWQTYSLCPLQHAKSYQVAFWHLSIWDTCSISHCFLETSSVCIRRWCTGTVSDPSISHTDEPRKG